ncbi:hypothetical protein M427DRAFT_155933 [Gonapodya prolifera JEL478]|uniref:Ribosomal protein bL31m N-terminal domain-containing protein n=1 Tax=Gonapodya prolifera (strain JEL478) TaxID=1344416 RepID=A0A139AC41_GONPJ|nr:hypothetical protein M427DRAFT_155933 [Gonapodya prolifera JEL478]|eukprot:KXS14366.1 hypothetical protein M427DRAFT_155933 [Gonapodya prolifera JEL478]
MRPLHLSVSRLQSLHVRPRVACVVAMRSKSSQPPLFTQQIVLSDGSTVRVKTTSPRPVLKLTKDLRNSPLWNPKLSVQVDESANISAFNARFGTADSDPLDFAALGLGFSSLSHSTTSKKDIPEDVSTPQQAAGKKKKK